MTEPATPADISVVGSQIIEQRRAHMPTWDDVQRECPKGTLTRDEVTGRTEFVTRDPVERRRIAGMTDGWRRRELERSAEQSARVPTETFTDRNGVRVTAPAVSAEKVARQRGLGVSGRRRPFHTMSGSLACPSCGFNRNLGRCTCEAQA